MIVDGKTIASDILAEVQATVAVHSVHTPRLSAITCAPNFETRRYLAMKKEKAALVGININLVELASDASTEDVIACVERVAKASDGVVVQLPLPSQINREAVLGSVPVDKDPDGFYYGLSDQACLPPVVGAIDEISSRYRVDWKDKEVVVLGQGRLVGLPVTHYAVAVGSKVRTYTRANITEIELGTADIIVSGIGQPHFVTKDMVKAGVVVFDAGTSEDGGVLVGDVHPEVGSVASLFTPVPGGIGPITIAYLLRNLSKLVSQ